MNPEWWYWIVGGLALVLAELVVPSFFIVWFGRRRAARRAAGAGLRVWRWRASWRPGRWRRWPWSWLWFRVFRRELRTRPESAPSDGERDWRGRPAGRGRRALLPARQGALPAARCSVPRNGICMADEAIAAGERVKVVGVEGSFLKVARPERLEKWQWIMSAGFVVALASWCSSPVTIRPRACASCRRARSGSSSAWASTTARCCPGLNIIIPYLDKIAYKLVTKDIILDVQEQEVITRDNAVILTNAIAFIKVTDPVKAVYGVTDFAEAIRNMIMTTLRSIVGEMELDEALSSRDKIKARLRESIADEAIDWGLTVKSVEIQDIKPSPSMQKAMEHAGRRRARAQGHGDPGRGREAVDDPRRPRRGWNAPSATPPPR
ncbi:MAG: SPFH domain-containing protein [Comamonadaceae bacterium]|nr:SPFH domain-containing protein [Comamonadaceae bacterium]